MTLLEFAKSNDFRDDTCYFVSSFGLGDSYYLCALLYAFIETYNLKVVFCIKESHKVVFDMFRWEYVILEDCGELCNFTNESNRDNLWKYSEKFQYPRVDSAYFPLCSKRPIPGRFHPPHGETLGNAPGNNFREFYCNSLSVDYSFHFKAPSNYPILSKEAESKILSIAPFNKIILFIPDARGLSSIPLEFFVQYVEMLHKKGYKILLNSMDKKYAINNVIDLDLSLSDAIALAALCNSVYAVRSGFCDIIASMARNLHVFYIGKRWVRFFSFNIILQRARVNEYLLMQTPKGYKVHRLGRIYFVKLRLKKLKILFRRKIKVKLKSLLLS